MLEGTRQVDKREPRWCWRTETTGRGSMGGWHKACSQ